MRGEGNKRGGLASGWILVTGVLLLCITGTGLTWWNYSRQVFSTACGVIQSESGGRIVLVSDYPADATKVIEPGHQARITIGKGDNIAVLKGVVVAVNAAISTVGIRLLDDPARCSKYADGTRCAVTIDTTVPPIMTK
ncbi:MAG: hypothetical protein WCP60_10200 [bacterium]